MIAWADQNDPRLDVLFDSLQSTSDVQEGVFLTEQIWQRWREIEDPGVAGLLSEGITAMGTNDLTAALDYFNQVVGRVPEFAEGWNKRATVYYLMGDYERSITDIRETLLREPRHFGAIAGFGWILLHQGDFTMAEHVLRKALSVNPFLVDVRRQLRALMDRRG